MFHWHTVQALGRTESEKKTNEGRKAERKKGTGGVYREMEKDEAMEGRRYKEYSRAGKERRKGSKELLAKMMREDTMAIEERKEGQAMNE